MDDFSRLRAEIKADGELTWAMVTDMGKRLDERIDQVEMDLQQFRGSLADAHTAIVELQSSLAIVEKKFSATDLRMNQLAASLDQFRKSLRESTRLISGRIRLSSERFDSMMEVIQQGFEEKASLTEIQSIDARLEALEQKQDPAA